MPDSCGPAGSKGVNGCANTGGGAGAAGSHAGPPSPGNNTGGTGGSGVVIIQYPGGPVATGGTIAPVPGCKTQHTFTSTGCFVLPY